MGFKDAKFAQALALPMAQKTVLIAICNATNDSTHETLAGQETLAVHTGASVKTVQRALGVLERMGIITRHRRHGQGGYRTSDRIVVNTAYRTECLEGAEPTRQRAYKALSPDLPDSQSRPTGLSDWAEEINQIDQPVDQPDNTLDIEVGASKSDALEQSKPARTFVEFYLAWPRHVGKAEAKHAWEKAIRRADPEVIYEAARQWRLNPHRPDQQFIPYPATWLNRDGWDDELPGPRTDRSSNTQNNLSYLANLTARENAETRGLTS